MSLANLNEDERAIVHACMECVASGKVILHDWEFPLTFGMQASEFLAIYDAWPNLDETQEKVCLAISNSMINLLAYPHKAHHAWNQYMSVPQAEVSRVLGLWRGDKRK